MVIGIAKRQTTGPEGRKNYIYALWN